MASKKIEKQKFNVPSEKKTIGWREWASLPQIKVAEIKVKVDTGATTSAMHAEDIKFYKSHGRDMVRFSVYPLQRDSKLKVEAVAEVFDHRVVKSSNGKSEVRPVIVTDVELMGKRWPIEVTLTNRDMMGFRMLLGREALRGRFIVDPEKSFLGKKRKKT